MGKGLYRKDRKGKVHVREEGHDDVVIRFKTLRSARHAAYLLLETCPAVRSAYAVGDPLDQGFIDGQSHAARRS